MAITLIINPGSSSKKYTFFEDGREILSVRYEWDGMAYEVCTIIRCEQNRCELVDADKYNNALSRVIELALVYKVISATSDIAEVGVRVVAPGTYFQSHQLASSDYIARLREAERQAPLHIPATIDEIERVRTELPQAKLVAVSDSAFHSTIPAVHRTYSILQQDTARYDIRRFGYHGLSVGSVVRQMPRVLGDQQKVIICHIGSGVSLTAVSDGKSIDTTMGYGPGSGMIMNTRAGDIEPGALLELMRAKSLSISEAYHYLFTQCGLSGLAGESDMRRLLDLIAQSDKAAEFALSLYTSRFSKLLASLAATLGGVDAVVLTATAAERSPELRSYLLQNLDWLGIKIDVVKNQHLISGNGLISQDKSPITVAVIHNREADEMVRITNECNSN